MERYVQRYRQAYKARYIIDIQTYRDTETQRYRDTDTQRYRLHRQKYRQIETHTEIRTEIHTEIQRLAVIITPKQRYRGIEIQRYGETYRATYRDTET
jgi:hypothetical protein